MQANGLAFFHPFFEHIALQKLLDGKFSGQFYNIPKDSLSFHSLLNLTSAAFFPEKFKNLEPVFCKFWR